MYQWDNNGNLLNDGVYTNTYDAADRLITTTQGANVYAFRYNGLGDRLKQTANSAVTTYTLDLNAGLTQVLADGSNTYLYGVMRIGEQQPGGFAYHLADALGSVRQLANASASVTLAKSYEPYGNALSSAGSGSSVFAFTGEQYDTSTNLLYLRARYYSGAQGRFLTADTWPGDHLRPASLNGWSYAEANPVNLTDPSGHCVFVGPACVIFVAGVAIVVYVAAIPAGQYLVEHSNEIAEEVEDIIGECERIVEDAFRRPFVGPIGDPFLPPLPQPYPTPAEQAQHKVLVVGEANGYAYTWSLHTLNPDWDIIGSTYGNGSNNQTVIQRSGNVTLLANVDATRLESGAVTGQSRYDAVVFNNPYSGVGGTQTAALISSFRNSARQILTPNGAVHINVTRQLLLDFKDVALALGMPDNEGTTIDALPAFGQSAYYAPYYPQYSDGNIMRWYKEDVTRVRYLKNFVFK